MSKPQWIRASQEDYEKLAEQHSLAVKALAAAEAKLAELERVEKALEARVDQEVSDRMAATDALADERRHADHQNRTLAETTDSLKHNHRGGSRDCMLCEVMASVSDHRARRAAAAPLSDAGASSEVANG